jgi:predicted RNase H-like HicB family nuclease
MKQYTYRVLLNEESEGGYTVTVPRLPGCVTYGATLEESIGNAREAISLYLESLVADGEEIPTDENTFEYSISIPA